MGVIDWGMILKMTAAVAQYVLITVVLWLMCRKRRCTTGLKVLIGLIYGACCILANHIGIDFGMLVLNVRDIGPLAAGLFFSPLSGILAGIIGGTERLMAGELWNIGRFTEIACALSTCLAGFLAAFLNHKIYRGRRPSVMHAFFLGALTEVFHMYAVLFTNRDDMYTAYTVVQVAAIPMICFTAAGMALCAASLAKLNGEKTTYGKWVPEEKTPIAVHFQRWLLVVTIGLFLFNFIVSYQFQTRLVEQNAVSQIEYLGMENADVYKKTKSLRALLSHLEGQQDVSFYYLVLDKDTGKSLTMKDVEPAADESAATTLAIAAAKEGNTPSAIPQEDMAVIREHLDNVAFTMRLTMLANEEILCGAVDLDEQYVLVTMQFTSDIYANRTALMYENTLSDILLFTVLYVLISMLVEYLVVHNLNRVNVSLDKITNGKLDEEVWVRTSSEFSELSDDINKTVTALKGYISAAERRMEEELQFAAQIQDAALPRNFNLFTDRIELRALMTPAKQVGGDFYDFFYIGLDQLALVIADVSGKGVPAALFMMRAKTAIKNFARSGMGPAELLENVNNTLCEGNDAEMFVTVWLGILDLNTGMMRCANAGHEHPAVMRAGGDYELLKDRHGLVLAEFENIKMKEYELQLNDGDRVFVYTDGVPEAVNEKLEQYGTDRMTAKLNRLKEMKQERVLEEMLRDIRNFAGSAEQFDDITMLSFTYRTQGV